MNWMTWELGNYLYFAPAILMRLAWSRISLILLATLGALLLTYPFLLLAWGNPAQSAGQGGYTEMVGWIFWMVGLIAFVVALIGGVFRIWMNRRLLRRDAPDYRG
jgi:hypothetical protein